MMTRYRWLFLWLAALVIATSAAACTGSEEPTAEPVPTREVAEPEGETEFDSAWARVEAEGTLRVATSADYPPFESINEQFEIEGFDIALIEAIADELGVETEISDFAFEGLGSALEADQADVAIAAISLTAEREGYFDFSHTYFVSEDAILASADAELDEITEVEGLAGLRVGVQRGSVFQDWLEDELIGNGWMDRTDLFLYARINEGLEDLQDGRVDVLVMDLPVAEVEAEQEGFQIVGQGLNRERYVIGMAKGENELRNEVNQALLTLLADGTVEDLAVEYIGLEPGQLLPVPTPAPNPTSAPPVERPGGCFDSMAWVSDLSYDDQNMTNPPVLAPGEVFQKGWRVRNTGTCTWDSSYSLQFSYGNRPGAQMGGRPVNVQGTVAPGQTFDFYVNLAAPLRSGTYQGVWQMHNGDNVPFGQRVYVGIRVSAGPTPTPALTATPSPNVDFNADDTNIDEGDCTTIRWNVSNIREVYFYRDGEDWRKNGVTGQGSREVCPSRTTTYVLRVVNTDDSVDEFRITIRVNENASAPDIHQFTLNPSGSAPVGTCTTLRWDVGGSVDEVDITRNGEDVWSDAPFRGSVQDCPPGAGDFTYTLEARGPGGNSRDSQSLRLVENAPTPTPAPTDTVPEPVIDGFSVNPTQVEIGGCVSIAWSTSGGTHHTKVLKNGAVVQDDAGLSGSLNDCLNEEGVYDYRLEAYNRADSMVSADVSVQVAGAQPTEAPPTDAPAPTEAPPEPTQPESVEITSFGADPTSVTSDNACTTLSWTIEGSGLALVTLTRNGESIATDPSSPYQDCLDESFAGTTVTYSLKADSEFGSGDTDELTVQYVAE